MFVMNLRIIFAALVFATLLCRATAQSQPSVREPDTDLLKEFRSIGGTGNNLANPRLNSTPGSPEIAIAPLNFARGTKNGLVPAPNPRTISNVIAGGTGAQGQNADTEDPVATAWIYVFGLFVDHDLDLEATPLTSAAINIVIPPGDPVFTAGTTIPMTRDTRSRATNTIINTVAGYLDLSQLYGSTPAIAASLTNPDGTLMSSDNGQALPVVNDTFITGDPRVMENPELTAITILFMREHNRWVATLKSQHPNWTGTQLYNMAKAITTAEYQNIVYTEFLPTLVGSAVGPYKGYYSTVNAQVSDTQEGLDNHGNVIFTQSLAQAFFNTPELDEANGINPLLRSIGTDSSEATDVYTVGALRNLLFAGLVGGGVDQMDLIAIDIRRESDVGLGTLNQTRRALGLTPYRSFADLTDDPVLQRNFQTVYGDISKLDLFMGGLAEKHASGAVVGPTFQTIIADQFQALRTGDRFFWLNQGFNKDLAWAISKTTLANLITWDTDTTLAQQHNVFVQGSPQTHNPPHVATPTTINTHHRKPSFHY
jgi:peroxidase